MSDITVRVSEYVRNKEINLQKMSRETGLPYRSLYDSLLSKKRNRDLRDHEFMSVCFFWGLIQESLHLKKSMFQKGGEGNLNELKIFESPEFGQVRTINIKGEPWFVGKDVAEALGYAELRSAVSKKVESEDRGVAEMETPPGSLKMAIINESGLYALIFGSRLESAKRFKHWVTSEVVKAEKGIKSRRKGQVIWRIYRFLRIKSLAK